MNANDEPQTVPWPHAAAWGSAPTLFFAAAAWNCFRLAPDGQPLAVPMVYVIIYAALFSHASLLTSRRTGLVAQLWALLTVTFVITGPWAPLMAPLTVALGPFCGACIGLRSRANGPFVRACQALFGFLTGAALAGALYATVQPEYVALMSFMVVTLSMAVRICAPEGGIDDPPSDDGP